MEVATAQALTYTFDVLFSDTGIYALLKKHDDFKIGNKANV